MLLLRKAAKLLRRCEPVTDVTGVATPRMNVGTAVTEKSPLLLGEGGALRSESRLL